jgi:epoxide hydrolase-like predicted phosphatase
MSKSKKPEIEALLVDLGGVLFEHNKALQKTAKEFGVSIKKILKVVQRDYKPREVDGKPIDECWKILFEDIGENIDIPSFQDKYHKNHPINEKLFSLLRLYKKNGMKFALVTNNIKGHLKNLNDVYEFFDIFDWIFDSSEMGIRKPDMKYYEEVNKSTGIEKSKCLFIDDTEEHIQAARKFGYKTFHFRDFDKSVGELERYLSNAGVAGG